MNEQAFEILEILPCDRIIREDNGKFSLIGVYSGGIVLPTGVTFPLALPLWYWVRIQRQKIAATAIKLEIANPEGSIVFSIEGDAVSEDLHPTALPFPGHVPTSVTGYGTYTAYLTADGERLNIGSFPIEPAKTKTPPKLVGGV